MKLTLFLVTIIYKNVSSVENALFFFENALFKQPLSHLFEAATPGKELVGGALGDESFGIEACLLQRFDALVDALGILLVATSLEDVLHALGILDLVGHVHAT